MLKGIKYFFKKDGKVKGLIIVAAIALAIPLTVMRTQTQQVTTQQASGVDTGYTGHIPDPSITQDTLNKAIGTANQYASNHNTGSVSIGSYVWGLGWYAGDDSQGHPHYISPHPLNPGDYSIGQAGNARIEYLYDPIGSPIVKANTTIPMIMTARIPGQVVGPYKVTSALMAAAKTNDTATVMRELQKQVGTRYGYRLPTSLYIDFTQALISWETNCLTSKPADWCAMKQ